MQNTKRRQVRIVRFLPLALAGTFAASGCFTPEAAEDFLDAFAGSFGETVTVTESDSTPPTVTLEIPDLGSGPIVIGPGDPPVTLNLSLGQNFYVVGVAEDPEGVQSVGFSGSSTTQCESGGLGSIQFATLLGPMQTDDASPGGTALTRRWQPTLITDAYGCGSATGSYSVSLVVRGRNFSGQEGVTSSVTFVYSF